MSKRADVLAQARSNDAYAWTGHGSGSTASVANGLNQLTSISGAATTHDTRGNLTADPATGKTYGYNIENMLASASGGVTLAYDPAMRLYQVAGASTIRFAYDGLAMIAEYDGSNTLLKRFVHGPSVDEPLVQYEGSGTAAKRWLHADERGSIIAQSEPDGTLATALAYDEYGKPKSTNLGRFQYTGQMWIAEAGLYHYKNRVYAPHLGRFLQTDPIGYEGGPNLYAYVGNDPINWIDPLGLHAIQVCWTNSFTDWQGAEISFWICDYDRDGYHATFVELAGSAGGDRSGSFEGGGAVGGLAGPAPGTGDDKPTCPTVPRTSIGSGFGFTTFLFTRGISASGSLNVSMPVSAWRTGLSGIEVSLSFNYTGLAGRGLFGGLGTSQSIGYATAQPTQGLSTSMSDILQGGAAWGVGGEISGQTGNSGSGSASAGSRAGYGAYLAAGRQANATFSTGPLFCG